MTRKDDRDKRLALLKKQPKNVLIKLIEEISLFLPSVETIESVAMITRHTALSKEAADMRNISIKMQENRRFHDPKFQRGLEIWDKSEKIQAKSDQAWKQLEKYWEDKKGE